mgnify:CR=1 FL=1
MSTVRVVGQFQAGDAAPMQVAVRHNNTVRFSATDAGAFDLTVNVTAGDTLKLDDFVVTGVFNATEARKATTAISTRQAGLANRASTQARAGAQPSGSRASPAAAPVRRRP